jgi:hypothetical protein
MAIFIAIKLKKIKKKVSDLFISLLPTAFDVVGSFYLAATQTISIKRHQIYRFIYFFHLSHIANFVGDMST